MAKSMIENARIDFITKLFQLEKITNKSGKALADYIGCSEPTLSRMRSDPGGVSGRWILIVQELHRKEDERRRI